MASQPFMALVLAVAPIVLAALPAVPPALFVAADRRRSNCDLADSRARSRLVALTAVCASAALAAAACSALAAFFSLRMPLVPVLQTLSWIALAATVPRAFNSPRNALVRGGVLSVFVAALAAAVSHAVAVARSPSVPQRNHGKGVPTIALPLPFPLPLPSHDPPQLLLATDTVLNTICCAIALVVFFATGFFSLPTSAVASAIPDASAPPPSKEASASIFSRITYKWLNDLITLGNSRTLNQEDVWDLLDNDKTKPLVVRLAEIRKAHPSRSLMMSIFTVVSPYLLFQFSCGLVSSILGFANPYFLYRIVSHIQDPSQRDPLGALPYLFGLFSCAIIKAITDGQMYFTGRRVGTRVRAILVSELYTKSLRRAQGIAPQSAAAASDTDETISTDGTPAAVDAAPADPQAADPQASLGKIVTLMSVDTERVRSFLSYCQRFVLEEPISVIIAVSGLFSILGWSALTSIALILAISPIGALLGKANARVQEELMSKTDRRIDIINEMLQGIRIIKYLSWEDNFAAKVTEARTNELNSLWRLWGTYIGFGNIGFASGLIVTFGTFVVYTFVAGQTLDAATAFTAVNLLGVVSRLMSFLPHDVMEIFKFKVAIDRIENFLKEPELDKYIDGSLEPPSATNAPGVGVATARENNSDSATADNSDSGEDYPIIGFESATFAYYGTTATDKNNLNGKGKVTEETPLLGANKPNYDGTPGSNTSGFVLRNMDVYFPIGGLSIVCGSTGAGKSSLILALLGEMERLAGRSIIPDSRMASHDPATGLTNSVAYVAQTAWLFNGTIRDNILFGEPYDEERYRRVVIACALAKDFENLDGGDLVEVGEKGLNLSGGQKQRISLARAAYSRASYVLLDDPLSAVDAPTARHLLVHCLLGALRGRTIVLVSHATGLVLPHADYALVMKNGEILCQGTPLDLTQNVDADGIYGIDMATALADEVAEAAADAVRLEEEMAAADHNVVGPDGKTTTFVAASEGTGRRLIEDEERATGSVKLSIYKLYFKSAGGIGYVAVYMFSFVLASVASLANDWWLKSWTDHNSAVQAGMSENLMSMNMMSDLKSTIYTSASVASLNIASARASLNNTVFASAAGDVAASSGSAQSDAILYVGIYALFGVGVIFANNFQLFTVIYGSLLASRRMHAELLDRILRAPLRFFETTPIGRILNRFSKDIESIDNGVNESIENFVHHVIQAATIIMLIGSVAPVFLCFAIPMMVAYYYIAWRYLTVSRELKRLESVSRSPIYALFNETLNGVATIRAYGAEKRFATLNANQVDLNHRSFFYIWAANRWLCLRTDFLSAIVVFVAGSVAIFGGITPGLAALMMTYALSFSDAMLWMVRMHAEMELSLNSVERVQEYLKVEQEPPAIVPNCRPPIGWPTAGAISVRDLSIRYAPDLPDVLCGVSFEVGAGEKIAVVGRTGSGKSTLLTAMFRILPMSGGSIVIDGVDIARIGLHDLRSNMVILPQDAVLFAGTLRSNLDPIGEHDDALLWTALKRVHFLDSLQQAQSSAETTASSSLIELEDATSVGASADAAVSSTMSPASAVSLDSPVTENGGNFSQGQRQLLCLARALLRRTHVVFLDEATASVDHATDAKIQRTIRDEFRDGTVVCIAHRLRTVADFDRVLVLDQGRVAEYGTPIDLISQPDGIFRQMCLESGEYDELVQMARDAAVERSARALGVSSPSM